MPFWRLYYHLVWATAGRQPIICLEIERQVHEAIGDKVKALDGEIFAVNGIQDHVHVAVTIPPSTSVAKFVGELKGSSSFHINHLPDNPYTVNWQKGYGAVSFRRDNLDQVMEYIRRQKEHHAAGRLWPSLEDCGEESASKPVCVREAGAVYDPFS